tara:strand:- start:3732 stop:4295 length:564 start_codon:yes stop_codon:yes gene_type:complete
MNDNFLKSYDKLMSLEHSKPQNCLHINKNENGFTFRGIYQTAHPKLKIWDLIEQYLREYHYLDFKTNSKDLHDNEYLNKLCQEFYKNNFWDRAKLDKIYSLKKCQEIFIFGVNAGMSTAIRKAQKILNVSIDGIIGNVTLNALNSFNEDDFDIIFDEYEIKYYKDIINKNQSFKIFENGWKKRALSV